MHTTSLHLVSIAAVFLLGLAATAALAGGFDLSWHTVDGGGITSMAGGGFTLDATAGQPDAGVLSGGGWEMVGGFWAVVPQVCQLPADLNGDGIVDALDIQRFVECMTGAGGACECAQLDAHAGLDLSDVPVFVELLLTDGE